MTPSKIQMDQIRSTSATDTGENIRAGSQKKSSLSQASGLHGASPDATCTCPSGDGSLRHPCPAHPAVEQAGGDERAAFEYWASDEGLYPKAVERAGNCYKLAQTQSYWMAWQARAALAQPSPVRSSLLINGYQLRAALELIAPDGTAKQLESEARIEWRQQDADFLEAGLYAWCAEYPEEGCVLLDEEPATAQPSQDAPYADGIADALERSDWTPKEALHWYAEGKHFDTVAGRTRVIDTGAVASNALKHLSLPYLEMKGDAELTELREAHAQPSPKCATCNGTGQIVVSGPHYCGELQPPEYETEPCDMCSQPSPAPADEKPGEILAAKLIETWVAKHGKPAPWSKIVEITALATNMPNDERDRLLALDDDVDAQAQQLHDLDKQCRDDVARALGLRPSQERGFAWSYLLASIKSCVRASEDTAQAQHSVPDVCDGKEQDAFEEWARKEGLDTSCHPMHWLFLDAKTNSARQGWKAALRYVRAQIAAAPGKEVGHE
ncbi:hypothetical protein ACSEQ5_14620 [Pseudomonas aeruginosa]